MRLVHGTLPILLLLLAGWYGVQAWHCFQGVLPYHAFDEYEYFLYARSYAQTGSLQTPFLEQDSQSAWGNFGTHGFAYGWLHGNLNLLVGEHWWNIPAFNLLLFVLSVLIIAYHTHPLPPTNRYVALLLWGCCFLMPVYIFSFMQESLHFFFTALHITLLFRIYQSLNYKTWTVAYIVFITIAAIFRANWILWLWALLPRFWHRKPLLILFNIGMTCIFFVYIKLIIAPYVVGFLPTLSRMLNEERYLESAVYWWQHFTENLHTYFRWYASVPGYFFAKYFMVGWLAYFTWRSIEKERGITMGICLVGVLQFGAVFSIYDTFDWREIRMLAPLYCTILMWSVQKKPRLSYALLGTFLLIFPSVHQLTVQRIKERSSTYMQFQSAFPHNPFEVLKHTVTQPNTIVMLRSKFARKGQIYLFYLPFLTENGNPIRYSVYYAPLHTAPNLVHDYMVVPQAIKNPTSELTLIYKNDLFFLYEVDKTRIPSHKHSKIF